MKSIRLLPVVIFAAVALLLFKGIGLLTSGSYVLGTIEVLAAGGGGGGQSAPAATPTAESGGVTMTMPEEPTMEDTAPTIDDGAPTLASKEDAGDGESPAAAGNGGSPSSEGGETDAVAEAGGETAGAQEHGAPEQAPGDKSEAPAAAEAGDAEKPAGETSTEAALTDAIPMIQDAAGKKSALTSEDGTPLTEKAVLDRLAQRRLELDNLESELDIRLALVEAAEKRLEERKTALETLEARINALVAEKKAMEDGEFKALVSMYETMKPTEAAPIFNQLDMNVLIRLARTMNPRKMAPILARMSADRAEQLTIAMVADQGEPTIDVVAPDLANLPQIIGQ